MQIDKKSLLVNMLELKKPLILVRFEQAKSTVEKNMIIDDSKENSKIAENLDPKIILDRSIDGKKKTSKSLSGILGLGGKQELSLESENEMLLLLSKAMITKKNNLVSQISLIKVD